MAALTPLARCFGQGVEREPESTPRIEVSSQFHYTEGEEAERKLGGESLVRFRALRDDRTSPAYLLLVLASDETMRPEPRNVATVAEDLAGD